MCVSAFYGSIFTAAHFSEQSQACVQLLLRVAEIVDPRLPESSKVNAAFHRRNQASRRIKGPEEVSDPHELLRSDEWRHEQM